MQTIQETVASVQNAPGSIYTREDVISLLNKIQVTESVTKMCPLTQFQIESLCDTITDAIRENAEGLDSDCIDKDSAEFTLNYSNCIELDSVGFDSGNIADTVVSGIGELIEDWFEKAFPESEEDESEEDNN
jgi:hypothetical protein